MLHWYALNTMPRQERVVATALQDRGLQIYLPMFSSNGRHGELTPTKPLFPGYLFCRCDFDEVSFVRLRWTPGLRSVVSSEEGLVVVPAEVIDLIEVKLESLHRAKGAHPFEAGDLVQIQSGPLQGLMGVFDGPKGPAERVRILVEFLGKMSKVKVSPQLLALISKPPRRTRGRGRWIKPFRPGVVDDGRGD